MPTYWMLVSSEENFERSRARGFDIASMKSRHRKKAERVQPGDKVEVVRMPGYFKPFHFVSMFEYVKAKAYKSQHFQKFLQAKADKMRAEGKEVKLW